MDRLEPKDVAALQKVRAERMRQSDVRDAFRGKVRESKDGKYKIDIKNDRRGIEKLRELTRPHRRAAAEFSATMAARQAKVTVRNPRGAMVEIAAHCENEAAGKGFLPAVIWSPVRKFAACPRRYFTCGHYTETADESVCPRCLDDLGQRCGLEA